MKAKKKCFAIYSYYQEVEIIVYCRKEKIFPVIIYIKHYMIERLGIDWLNELSNLLEKKISKKNFQFYIDCKNNYGLFISLVEKKINYLKVDAKKETFESLNQIALKNKVLLNPNFDIIDILKSKKKSNYKK